MSELINNIWAVYLDTAVWLLFGLLIAGLVKVYIPADAMQRWLGGSGVSAVGRAALFGAPLPLCSCGVLPAALGLRRAGASKEATVSFLISTPETSIDSVAVTYALMGPLMAIYRPFAALTSAIVTGLMVSLVKEEPSPVVDASLVSSCCASEKAESSCCGTASESAENGIESSSSERQENRLIQAVRFAGADLLDDISKWMAFGIVFAGLIMTLVPEGWLAQWGGGLPAMLIMLVVGIPMYICAVASTPVAAGLLIAGVSPGAVLVFLLVGPATNIASLLLVRQELGSRVTLVYLAGISGVSILMGLALEMMLANYGLSVEASIGHDHTVLPYTISVTSAIILLVLALPALRNRLLPFFARG